MHTDTKNNAIIFSGKVFFIQGAKMQFVHYRIPSFQKDEFGFSCYRNGIKARGGQTIAMTELTCWFVNSLQEGEFFSKLIGKSVCSKKDNYNKKIGRELALNRLTMTKLIVNKILIFGKMKSVELKDDENNKYRLQCPVYETLGMARFVAYIPK